MKKHIISGILFIIAIIIYNRVVVPFMNRNQAPKGDNSTIVDNDIIDSNAGDSFSESDEEIILE